MTLISRVLGLIRDSVIATTFGANHATDAFFVAFKIPNLFRRLFAEGAFSQAFVPVLSGYRSERPAAEVKALIDAVSGALTAILFGVTVLGVIAAPAVVAIFAPGFVRDAANFELSVTLLRLTFPYLFFIALTALLAGVLNTYGRFGVPAVTPSLLNIALILSAVFLAPRLAQPVYALAIGVMIGGVLQLGLQIAAVKSAGLLPHPRWDWSHPGVKRILTLMGPALFGVSVAQLNFLIDTLIASFLREGSISWLYFSDRLMEFPLGIFGVALGTVILPSLAEFHSKNRPQQFSDTLDWALRLVLLITLPSAIGLAVLAAPILSTLFQYGAMTEFDVLMATKSLVTYAGGLSGFIFVKVLAPAFFARQDTKTPVKAGVIALITNAVLNVALVFPLQHAGLALATSIAAFINSAILLVTLRRLGVYHPRPGWGRFASQVFAAAAIMGTILHVIAAPLPTWTAWHAGARAGHLVILVIGGCLAYGAGCLLFGLRKRDVAQPRAEI